MERSARPSSPGAAKEWPQHLHNHTINDVPNEEGPLYCEEMTFILLGLTSVDCLQVDTFSCTCKAVQLRSCRSSSPACTAVCAVGLL